MYSVVPLSGTCAAADYMPEQVCSKLDQEFELVMFTAGMYSVDVALSEQSVVDIKSPYTFAHTYILSSLKK